MRRILRPKERDYRKRTGGFPVVATDVLALKEGKPERGILKRKQEG